MWKSVVAIDSRGESAEGPWRHFVAICALIFGCSWEPHSLHISQKQIQLDKINSTCESSQVIASALTWHAQGISFHSLSYKRRTVTPSFKKNPRPLLTKKSLLTRYHISCSYTPPKKIKNKHPQINATKRGTCIIAWQKINKQTKTGVLIKLLCWLQLSRVIYREESKQKIQMSHI